MPITLIAHTPTPDAICGQAAAICTGFAGDPVQALRGAMASGHESVAEHATFAFLVEGISRVTLAQLTRHRLASYSVQSQRYCGADMGLVIPDSMCIGELVDDIDAVAQAVEALYTKAVSLGVPEEDARYLTFQAGKTRLMLTMNARELRHFFALRCCTRAQWEIRALANEMLRLCREAAPVLFADAGPGCVRGHCPEGTKSCKRRDKA